MTGPPGPACVGYGCGVALPASNLPHTCMVSAVLIRAVARIDLAYACPWQMHAVRQALQRELGYTDNEVADLVSRDVCLLTRKLDTWYVSRHPLCPRVV